MSGEFGCNLDYPGGQLSHNFIRLPCGLDFSEEGKNMNIRISIATMVALMAMGACANSADQKSQSTTASEEYNVFQSAAAAIVACIEAGGGKMTQTEFDETGACQNGVNIWRFPSLNPAINSHVAISYGNQFNGKKIGSVRFKLSHNLVNEDMCGFNMTVNHSSEDILVSVPNLTCSPVKLLPKTLSLKIISIECSEIDPYEVGDACVVTASDSQDELFTFVGWQYDLLDQYSYEQLQTFTGRNIEVQSANLSQMAEPGALAVLNESSDSGAAFWWNNQWTLIDSQPLRFR